MADIDQIQQVFINLIINASEAMTDGGKLEIETKQDSGGDYIIVIFKDSGPGMPDNVIAKIFDPFFTTKEQGTGLGLSISHGIIERHGGKILLDSKPGKGTTFTISLPVNFEDEGDD